MADLMPDVEKKEPIPIFVIGMNRSGTKWLSNELSKHPEISCVKNEVTGIRETNMLSSFGNKFDIKVLDEYIGLVELWAATGFFERTSVDKTILYERDTRPASSYEMFETVMDEFSRLQKTKYWLQKTNPILGRKLSEIRPNAKFVVIYRNMKDQIRSNLARTHARPSTITLARAVFSYVRDRKILDQIVKKINCPVVKYESLKTNRDEELANIFATWKLDRGLIEENIDLKPNTSFGDQAKRDEYFSTFHHFIISSFHSFRCWPNGSQHHFWLEMLNAKSKPIAKRPQERLSTFMKNTPTFAQKNFLSLQKNQIDDSKHLLPGQTLTILSDSNSRAMHHLTGSGFLC